MHEILRKLKLYIPKIRNKCRLFWKSRIAKKHVQQINIETNDVLETSSNIIAEVLKLESIEEDMPQNDLFLNFKKNIVDRDDLIYKPKQFMNGEKEDFEKEEIREKSMIYTPKI